jgi:hypothetical protein
MLRLALCGLALASVSRPGAAASSSVSGGGSGGSLLFNGNQTAARVLARTHLLPEGAFQAGVTVSFWFRTNSPMSFFSRSSRYPGSTGTYFNLWSARDDVSPDFSLIGANDYNAFTVNANGHAVRGPSQSTLGVGTSEWAFMVVSWDPAVRELVVWSNPGTAEALSFNTSDRAAYEAASVAANDKEPFDFSSMQLTLARAANVSLAGRQFFVLGSGSGSDYDFNGELDEFCAAGRAVSGDEAVALLERGCMATLGGDVLVHYSFDDPLAPFWDSAANRSTAVASSRVASSCGGGADEYDFLWMAGKGSGYPRIVAGSAPGTAGRVLLVRNTTAEPVPVRVRCLGSCAGFRLASAPAGGFLCSDVAAANLSWTPPPGARCPAGMFELDAAKSSYDDDAALLVRGGGNASAFLEWSLWYVPNAALGAGAAAVDGFAFDLASAAGGFADGARVVVTVSVNSPPRTVSSRLVLSEKSGAYFALPDQASYALDAEQPVNALRIEVLRIEFNASYGAAGAAALAFAYGPDFSDPDADEASLAAPENQLGGGGLARALPLTLDGLARMLHVAHSGDVGGPAMACVYWRAFDGWAWSDEARLDVDVRKSNRCPEERVGSANVTLDEDTRVLVDLGALFLDREGDAVLLALGALPATGVLYEAREAEWAGTERALRDTAASPPLAQWIVADAPTNAASSCWDEDFCVGAIGGPPDVYPDVSDSIPTWQPLSSLGLHWLDVAFGHPVFPTQLALYESWSPGGAYLIELEDFDVPGRWLPAWSGPNRQRSFCPDRSLATQCPGISLYELCPLGVRSNRLRVHIKMDSPERWPAVDAMLLTGVEQAHGKALLNGTSKLWFVPDADANTELRGADAIRFSALDCPYFARAGTLVGPATRHASLPVRVAAVGDAPQLPSGAKPEPALLPRIALNTSAALEDADGLGSEHALLVTAADPADWGELRVAGLLVDPLALPLAVPSALWRMSNATTTLRPTAAQVTLDFVAGDCTDLQAWTYSFTLELRFPGEAAAQRTVRFRVDCPSLPTVNRRVGTSQSTRLVGLGLGAAGAAVALPASAWWLAHRQARAVKLASGQANQLVLLGTLLVFSSVALMALDGADFASCKELGQLGALAEAYEGMVAEHCPAAALLCEGKLYLFGVGFQLVLAMLFCKMERINTVFNNKRMKKVVFTERTLVIRTLMYTALIPALLAAFTYTSPQFLQASVGTAIIDTTAQLRVLPITEACSSKNQNALVTSLGIIFLGLALRASYMAYLTRKVNIAEINDSKEVGLCIYNILLFGTASFLVSSAISSPDAVYLSTAVPIWLISTGLIALLYYPKMCGYRPPEVAPSDTSSTTMNTGIHSSSAATIVN